MILAGPEQGKDARGRAAAAGEIVSWLRERDCRGTAHHATKGSPTRSPGRLVLGCSLG